MTSILPEIVVYYMLVFSGFGYDNAHRMTCVAKYESAYNYKALNLDNKNDTIDIGLFQINTVWFHTIPECDSTRLLNPLDNIKCAKHVYDKQGLSAWVAYNRNKQTCDNYKVKLK